MKKLLLGLALLGSMSSFANVEFYQFTPNETVSIFVRVMKNSHSCMILENSQNASVMYTAGCSIEDENFRIDADWSVAKCNFNLKNYGSVDGGIQSDNDWLLQKSIMDSVKVYSNDSLELTEVQSDKVSSDIKLSISLCAIENSSDEISENMQQANQNLQQGNEKLKKTIILLNEK